ncbi:hypothetical protein HELRODRAFT_158376 [Helobdella robusta]|uniref:Uncharacterized protein n=1 Tax=Helobdella robusta TaxID=6412 RepID=T1EMQ4_HELRO|nr:hypothetical protein HELRODRAFT_158376 [Helobdella robusta]ESO11991.1 hypothetical protein HELRODRAFT_158376 [Helobdella robusta]
MTMIKLPGNLSSMAILQIVLTILDTRSQWSMAKSTLPTEVALREFLMQYRKTPLTTGLSPRKEREENYNKEKSSIGQPCYVKYYGPRRDRQARWVPATVFQRLGRRHSKSVLDTVPTKMATQGKSLGPSPNLTQGIQSSNQLFDPISLPGRSEQDIEVGRTYDGDGVQNTQKKIWKYQLEEKRLNGRFKTRCNKCLSRDLVRAGLSYMGKLLEELE